MALFINIIHLHNYFLIFKTEHYFLQNSNLLLGNKYSHVRIIKFLFVGLLE